MADNTQLNPGSGGDVIKTEDLGLYKLAVSKIYLGAHGVDGGPVGPSNPMPVSVNNGVGAPGFVRLSDGAAPQGVSINPMRIDPTGTTTQPVSGTVAVSTASFGANLQLGGSAVAKANPVPVIFADSSQAPQSVTAADSASTISAGANAQSEITGTPTANSTSVFAVSGESSFEVEVAGTFAGTLQFEGTIDAPGSSSAVWVPVGIFTKGTSVSGTATSAPGVFMGSCAGATAVRARATAWSSGTASVSWSASAAIEIAKIIGPVKLFDGTNTATVKAASAPPVATDTALVATLRDSITVGNFPATQPVSGSVAVTGTVSTTANLNVAGSAVAAGNPVPVATVAALPAGTNTIGAVISQMATGVLYSGTSALTPQFAPIAASAAGDNTLVAALAGKKVRVLKYTIVTSGSVAVKFRSSSGTDLTGAMSLGANSGIGGAFCPIGLFEALVGDALVLNLSAPVPVAGHLTFVEI